jgi:hypothetical protein
MILGGVLLHDFADHAQCCSRVRGESAVLLQCHGHSKLGFCPTFIGSRIVGSSLSGLLTRVEIGHIVMGSLGYGTNRSRGSGSIGDSQRSYASGGTITGRRGLEVCRRNPSGELVDADQTKVGWTFLRQGKLVARNVKRRTFCTASRLYFEQTLGPSCVERGA